MIKFYKTIDGKICRLDQIEDGCWINVVNPNENEISYLMTQFSLEPDFLLAALDEEESPRIECEDGKTLVIIDTPIAEKNDDGIIYFTMPVGILLTQHHVITVSLKENAIISEFANGVVKDRKSTRLNSSHVRISYAVFCLKK